jgi:hypothetical protein
MRRLPKTTLLKDRLSRRLATYERRQRLWEITAALLEMPSHSITQDSFMATMTMSPKSNAKTQQSCATTSIIVIVQEVDDTKGLEEGMEVAATMVATVVEGMEVEVTEEGQ